MDNNLNGNWSNGKCQVPVSGLRANPYSSVTQNPPALEAWSVGCCVKYDDVGVPHAPQPRRANQERSVSGPMSNPYSSVTQSPPALESELEWPFASAWYEETIVKANVAQESKDGAALAASPTPLSLDAQTMRNRFQVATPYSSVTQSSLVLELELERPQ